MRIKFLALAAAVLVCGCAAPQVEQANNPFSRDRQGAAIHKLSLALVLPALRVVKRGKAIDDPALSQQNREEPETMYREILGIFYQDFKRVTLVKSLSDPRVAEADIVASLDVTLNANPQILTVTSSFYNAGHGSVAVVRTQASAGSTLFTAAPETTFAELSPQIPDALDGQLQESSELRQYAQAFEAKRLARAQSGRPESRPARTFDSDADRPAYSFAENPKAYAVVVGVENYQNIPPAEFASRDANAVRAHLRALGYPAQNIITLTDAQATGNAVRSYVESWLPRNVTEDSKVFFYFSGHGAPDAESHQAYLVPWDGDPQYLADTGYPLKRLYQKLNGLKAQRVIVAMDSCFSGAGGHSVLAKGARPLMTRVDAGSAADMGKVSVLAAAGAEEITGEEEAQGHGLFTYYLLKSLNDGAGKNSLNQIYSYVKPKVEETARRSNRGQTPQLLGSNENLDVPESFR